jgi:hypothetical protein
MATLVTLETVKQHLRKTSTDEDTVIAAYRTAAIAYVGKYTGHLLIQQEVTDSFAAWGDFLTLRHQPITVDDQTYPWTIHAPYSSDFPTLADNGTITVTYTAGYATGEVPDELNAAVLLLCGHWYANRSAVEEGSFQELPLAVVSLCRPFRGAVMA